MRSLAFAIPAFYLAWVTTHVLSAVRARCQACRGIAWVDVDATASLDRPRIAPHDTGNEPCASRDGQVAITAWFDRGYRVDPAAVLVPSVALAVALAGLAWTPP
jgi:hypothetical protein